ncbi:MAG TPA: hypothetical protein VIK55_04785 [Paludibacter sp.]
MKAKVASLLVVILLITTQCLAQKRITVEAQNDDISNNLDLQAVASVFGESKDLQDFEMRLNDYDSQISNLDLNNDGEVDYLRVIESSEDNVHVVVIQAVLDRDVFQDVATIVVERNDNRRTIVQVIGDPYMYGDNYIIEPVYEYTPSIFSFFWGSRYSSWNSPYYWGYYPRYYRNRQPYEVNMYMSHINSQINRDHRYYYTNTRRNINAERLESSVSRNDYGKRYPDRNFTNRNENVRNKQDIQVNRNGGASGLQTRPTYQGNESGRRNPGAVNNINGTRNTNMNERNTNNRTYTPSNTPTRNAEINRSQNVERNLNTRSNPNSNSRTYQTPSNNYNNESRTPNTVRPENNPRPTPIVNQPGRESYQTRPANNNNESRPSAPVVRENNTRSTPVVNQPSRTETKPVERKPTENTRSNDSKSDKGNRSGNSESNRR